MLTPTPMGDPGNFAGGDRDSADPVRWSRAHDLFQAALELPLDQRQAFLGFRVVLMTV